MLLHSDVGEMHLHVRDLTSVHRETRVRKTSETAPININGQRLVRSDQDVDSQIELLATDEKRIRDVTCENVRINGLIFCIN